MENEALIAQALSKVAETRYETFYLLPILTLALLCRLYPLDRGLGQDELYTAVHFVEAPSIWKIIFSNDAFNNHIGYSLMARFSEGLLGRSEWALRLPALLLGMATLCIFFIFARSILGYVPALLGTLLLALSPPHIGWSVAARGYSAMIFFTLLSSYLYLRLLRDPVRREAVVFIGASVLGIYTHLYSVFVTLIQILVLIYLYVTPGITKQAKLPTNNLSFRLLRNSFTAIAVISVLLYAPVFPHMFRDLLGRGRSDFNPTFPWAVIQELSGSEWPQIIALVALVSLLGWFALLQSRRLEAGYFSLLLAGPLLIVWLARPFDLYPRFFAYWLPYYLLLFIAGLHSLWYFKSRASLRSMRILSLILSTMILATVLYTWVTNWHSYNYILDEGYREASRAIMTGAKEPVVFCAIGGGRSLWQYYIHGPIVTPSSVAELQKLGMNHSEVRCVYYHASWQSLEQTKIAEFLLQHGSWSKVKGFTLFIYRG
jgi:dolichyl-phosphate-mannose-protein mannosyltransferase